jgi:hypothetical protein
VAGPRKASSLLSRLRSALGRTSTPPDHHDAFRRLVVLQQADGSWELTPELATALSRSLPEVEAALPEVALGGIEARRVWATALVLAWMEQRPGEEALFEMGVRKAREWLARNPVPPRDGGDWLVKARAFLG